MTQSRKCLSICHALVHSTVHSFSFIFFADFRPSKILCNEKCQMASFLSMIVFFCLPWSWQKFNNGARECTQWQTWMVANTGKASGDMSHGGLLLCQIVQPEIIILNVFLIAEKFFLDKTDKATFLHFARPWNSDVCGKTMVTVKHWAQESRQKSLFLQQMWGGFCCQSEFVCFWFWPDHCFWHFVRPTQEEMR